MTITLFQDTNFRDRSMTVAQSIADLKDVSIGKNPSSLRMTGASEAILLYTRRDWDGDVHYLRGPADVADLGDGSAGGETGFRNNVRAVRISPFTLKLNVNVIRNEAGDFPGDWTAESAGARVETIVAMINQFFIAQRALLRLEAARIVTRTSNAKFNLSLTDQFRFPGAWRIPHEIDVMIVNQFEKDGVLGVAKFPHLGRTVMAAASYVSSTGAERMMANDDMAEVLAHELGHYLGLQHNTSSGSTNNLMQPSTSLSGLSGRTLSAAQIEEMQQKLARATARGADRHA